MVKGVALREAFGAHMVRHYARQIVSSIYIVSSVQLGPKTEKLTNYGLER